MNKCNEKIKLELRKFQVRTNSNFQGHNQGVQIGFFFPQIVYRIYRDTIRVYKLEFFFQILYQIYRDTIRVSKLEKKIQIVYRIYRDTIRVSKLEFFFFFSKSVNVKYMQIERKLIDTHSQVSRLPFFGREISIRQM